jgi:hypothetical protein
MTVLYAPEAYVSASPEVRAQVTNGCGPGGWKFDIVPDTIYGLNITEACNIHDWMYTVGEDLAAKDEADRVFLNNVLRLIEAAQGFWAKLLRPLRRVRAREYYEAVHVFGGPAFWDNKNAHTSLLVV